MLLFAIEHPNDFNARVNQIGIFQSGWLDREMVSSGKTAGTILREQFQKAFLAFNHYPDRVFWYGSRIPLMEFWASIFFASRKVS